MSQIFANFVDRTGQHGLGDLQAKSKSASMSNASPNVDVTWNVAFPDTNYGVVLGIETAAGFENDVTLDGFSKIATGVHVNVSVPGGTIAVTVHALAFKY